MAVRAVVAVCDLAANGATFDAMLKAGFVGPELPNGESQAATFNVSIDVDDTPANIEQMIVNQTITYALNTWGVTLQANKIVLPNLKRGSII